MHFYCTFKAVIGTRLSDWGGGGLFWGTLLSFLVNIRSALLWQSVRLDFVFGVVTSLFSFVNMTSVLLLCLYGTLLG